MKIYTVVGEVDYEGISELGPSFSDKEDAQYYASKCAHYDANKQAYKSALVNGIEMKKWRSNHPMTSSRSCRDCDSYDVIEHELVGVLDSIKTHMNNLEDALNRGEAMRANHEAHRQQMLDDDKDSDDKDAAE